MGFFFFFLQKIINVSTVTFDKILVSLLNNLFFFISRKKEMNDVM